MVCTIAICLTKNWQSLSTILNQKINEETLINILKKVIVDAILYVVKGGITWRLLPNDFSLWKTVFDHFIC